MRAQIQGRPTSRDEARIAAIRAWMVQQKEKFLPKVLFAVGAEIVVLPNVRPSSIAAVR